MHKHHGPPDTSKGYEQTDLSITDITKGVIGFFVFTAICGIVVFVGMYMAGLAKEPPPQAFRPIPKDPYPLLQNEATARVDMHNLRYRENQQLESAGASETVKGGQRIPIDSAIDILSERGVNSMEKPNP